MLCVQKKKAFTIVELLVVVAIIALLVGIMVPAVRGALDRAKDLAVKTQLASISTGLELFKSDAGEYPTSSYNLTDRPGAQLLCDFLVGTDLRGPFVNGQQKNPYVKQEGIDFEPYPPDGSNESSNESYVMKGKWGHAILYYRAAPGAMVSDDIINTFDYTDNADSIQDYFGQGTDDTLTDSTSFYEYITNPQIGNPTNLAIEDAVPYMPDSFILISAGKDGIYGNEDDIANFDRKGNIVSFVPVP